MYTTASGQAPPTPASTQTVLLISDDPPTAGLLTSALRPAGYRIVPADGAATARERLAVGEPDLVVLDVALAELDQLTTRPVPAAELPPLLLLIGCQLLDQLVPELGPELGPAGVDYVVKPLRTAEVLARAQVLLRTRPAAEPARTLRYGDLVLDTATCQARRGQLAVDLTPTEYRLLRQLLVNAERVLPRERICRHLWGGDRDANTVEKLVSRLRRKLDQDRPPLIHTVTGVGYWLGH